MGARGRHNAPDGIIGPRRLPPAVTAAVVVAACLAWPWAPARPAPQDPGAPWDIPGLALPPLLDLDRTTPPAPAVAAAQALAAQGRWQEAVEALVGVVSAGSRAADDDRAHGLMLTALAFAAQGRPEQAHALLAEAAARRPDSAAIRVNQARLYAQEGRLADAEAALKEAQALAAARPWPQLWPQAAAIHHRLGLLALESGQAERAAEHFRQAVLADPGVALYRASYGSVLRAMGRLPEAADQLGQAVELLGTTAPAGLLVEAGMACLAAGRFQEAKALFARAAGGTEAPVEAFYGLGLAEAALGHPAEARRHLERVVAQVPWHWRAHLALGAVRRALGDAEGARRAYEEAVRLAPAAPEPRSALGLVYLELGLYREALEQLQAALALGDERPEVLYALGRTQLREGRAAEAGASFARAAQTERDPARRAVYLYAQALAAEASGDVPSAVKLLRQAVEVDPALFEAQLRLGELLLAGGDAPAAVTPLEKALALRPSDARARQALEAAKLRMQAR